MGQGKGTGRGGARKGAGRPPKAGPEKITKLTIGLTPAQRARLEDWATAQGVSASEAIRDLVEAIGVAAGPHEDASGLLGEGVRVTGRIELEILPRRKA